MLHGKLLADPWTAGNILNPRCHATLPGPCSPPPVDMICSMAKDMGIQVRFRVLNAQELKDRFHTGGGRGSKRFPGRFLSVHSSLPSASQSRPPMPGQDLVQVPALLRDHTAGQQAGFLEGEGIVRIPGGLQGVRWYRIPHGHPYPGYRYNLLLPGCESTLPPR